MRDSILFYKLCQSRLVVLHTLDFGNAQNTFLTIHSHHEYIAIGKIPNNEAENT